MKYYQAEESRAFSVAHSFQKALGQLEKRWLEAQDTYTLHKPVKRRFLQRATTVPGAHF